MTNFKFSSRRNFLKQASFLGAATVLSPMVVNGSALNADIKGGDYYTFLFQDDSITDGNRSRNQDWNHVLGHGYAYLIASRLLFKQTHKDFHFFNRRVSGNKITDLAQRWQDDALTIKPNLISILIGVNATNCAVYGSNNSTIQSFEDDYRDHVHIPQVCVHLLNQQGL